MNFSILGTTPDISGIIFKHSCLQRPFTITAKYLDFIFLTFEHKIKP
jgi:hypothetical protein